MTTLLEIQDLSVSYGTRATLHQVSLTLKAGEVLALVGESGSGKSTTAQAVIGLLPEGGHITGGRITLSGEDITTAGPRKLRTLRGRVMSLVPQDPASSLNPVQTIGTQLVECFEIHGLQDKDENRREALALLEKVGLSQPELRLNQYPHELSGGMKQRVLIAIALALKPALVIADEPTSALDVTVQQRILELIDTLRREYGTAVLLITHDLPMAADRADRIIVMQKGRIQEEGTAQKVLLTPEHPYTRQLISDAPRGEARPAARARAALAIRVTGLTQDYPTHSGVFRAVENVGFSVSQGTTHALVGESGSGKTTTARAIAGFNRPTSGRIDVLGTDVTTLRGEALRQYRRKVQLVYQNPFAALNPRQSIAEIIIEPLLNFERLTAAARDAKVRAALAQVALPEDFAPRKPEALSGGQRQRVAIARALILQPDVLVLDEAVSALDVSVQAQILRLLEEIQNQHGLTYLFVSHDLAVVRAISHSLSVMQSGRIVESGGTPTVFAQPEHDYTRNLIAAIPGKNFQAQLGAH